MSSPTLLHYSIFESRKCNAHPNDKFTFFCFTCHQFLCNKCYKLHKKHEIEIREDLKKNSEVFSEMPIRKNFNALKLYEELKKNFEDLDLEIHRQIVDISDMIHKLKNNREPIYASKEVLSIFNLSYDKYQQLSMLVKYDDELSKLKNQINKTFESCELKSYRNTRYINKEVGIIDATPFHEGYEPAIILEQVKGNYYLAEGTRNHSISFDLKKYYFLKGIKISVDNFECTLKSFQISVRDAYGDWKVINNFVKEPYNENTVFQYFPICCEGRYFKILFIDNWGAGGGPYILVKRISFLVGDLIE